MKRDIDIGNLVTASACQERPGGSMPSNDLAVLVRFAGSAGFRATSVDLLPGKPSMKAISRMRGPTWESYLIEALEQTPWMQARALSGVEGADQMQTFR